MRCMKFMLCVFNLVFWVSKVANLLGFSRASSFVRNTVLLSFSTHTKKKIEFDF